MNIPGIKLLILLFSFYSLTAVYSCRSDSQNTKDLKKTSDNSVKISGKMKDIMWKGELSGTIDIDTISDKEHLYGLGPVEYLRGEIIIVDGKGYRSTVKNDSIMEVTETLKLKAPMFAYANIDSWKAIEMPDSVLSIPAIENFLEQNTQNIERPFVFKISGSVDSAVIHVVNLKKGAKVSSPDEAHEGQKDFFLKNKTVELVGFFSTEHKGIFTHHDTNIHIHLITEDKKQMGHLDKLNLKKGSVKLFLPIQ